MVKLIVAAAIAVSAPCVAASAALLSPTPHIVSGTALTLAAAKKAGVIPANCAMDPFKKVYVCCTQSGGGDPVCTEHPLDTKWPLKQTVRPQQTAPVLQDPAASQ